MNKLTRVLLLCCLCISVCAGVLHYQARAKYSLTDLHNSQVRWEGTYVGIMPFLSGKADAVAQANDPEFLPGLIRCLENDEQYAAAYVILSYLKGGSLSISGGSWNGLDVQLIGGQAKIPAACPPELKQHWQNWYRNRSTLGF